MVLLTSGPMSIPLPFVTLMRRYVEEYTNAHDLEVCDEIFHPDYRIHIGGTTLEFDGYREMVRDAFGRFPDLQLVVHRLVSNGDRLAMHFSEYATSPAHENRQAVWEGVGLYRRAPDGRLIENYVEQDFYGRRVQLASDDAVSVPRQDPSVWATPDVAPDEITERAVHAWVETRNEGGDSGEHSRIAIDQVLAGSAMQVRDLFSAGGRFGVRLSVRGDYVGELYGVPEHKQGSAVALDAVAIGRIENGRVAALHLISDRFGLQSRLKSGVN